jgi:hypothetical protein
LIQAHTRLSLMMAVPRRRTHPATAGQVLRQKIVKDHHAERAEARGRLK